MVLHLRAMRVRLGRIRRVNSRLRQSLRALQVEAAEREERNSWIRVANALMVVANALTDQWVYDRLVEVENDPLMRNAFERINPQNLHGRNTLISMNQARPFTARRRGMEDQNWRIRVANELMFLANAITDQWVYDRLIEVENDPLMRNVSERINPQNPHGRNAPSMNQTRPFTARRRGMEEQNWRIRVANELMFVANALTDQWVYDRLVEVENDPFMRIAFERINPRSFHGRNTLSMNQARPFTGWHLLP